MITFSAHRGRLAHQPPPTLVLPQWPRSQPAITCRPARANTACPSGLDGTPQPTQPPKDDGSLQPPTHDHQPLPDPNTLHTTKAKACLLSRPPQPPATPQKPPPPLQTHSFLHRIAPGRNRGGNFSERAECVVSRHSAPTAGKRPAATLMALSHRGTSRNRTTLPDVVYKRQPLPRSLTHRRSQRP